MLQFVRAKSFRRTVDALAVVAAVVAVAFVLRARAEVEAIAALPPRDAYAGLPSRSFELRRGDRLDLPGLRLAFLTIVPAALDRKGAVIDAPFARINAASGPFSLWLPVADGGVARLGDFAIVVDELVEGAKAPRPPEGDRVRGRAIYLGDGDPSAPELRPLDVARRDLATIAATEFQGLEVRLASLQHDGQAARLTLNFAGETKEASLAAGESVRFGSFSVDVDRIFLQPPGVKIGSAELTIRSHEIPKADAREVKR
jgi:hypothetical protein